MLKTPIKLLSGFILILREKPQGLTTSLIVLPGTKYTTSKNCIVLAAADKITKLGARIESPVKAGDVTPVVQYDRGHEILAWDDLTFEIDKETESKINPDFLPDGCEKQVIENLETEEYTKAVFIKKGTPLQVLQYEDLHGVLVGEARADDQ